ncbi:LysR family transcriptional regulator [Streptomyces sp. DSM 44915]|uniref:LysR family transcriptional regulator n=1 Tax=Streptomyces chisholmiae TaxID=3075540 RepID=A0ABU2JU86_9ACTN|nr:LysR family transcriptional regulator [Streptomyces sp. DSM 44915]MDT0268556.1 LysR family transcriptional regulator [Streptomyces sp. DSM 44915]
MDLHLLRTFETVARLRSFSAAARELGYTQSAVSQQIATLETDVRTRLLDRRPVAPTPAGGRLLEHAGPLLLRAAAARADLARLVTAPGARLTVGAAPLAQPPVLAGALAAVHRTHPGVALTLRVLPAAEIPALVATGELDAGVVEAATAPTDPLPLPDLAPLASRVVLESPLVVALPTDHPLARHEWLRLADLADARWLDAPTAAVPLGRLRAVLGSDGFPPAARYAGGDPAGLLRLVAAGHGLAALPAPLVAGVPGTVAVPVTVPRLVHRVELLHAADPAPSAAALATFFE